MLFSHLFGRLKAIVLAVLAIFNRALCCFSRKRRNSYSDDSEVLQMVSVVNQSGSAGGAGRKAGENDRDWNSWDESPRTVDEHIEQYRQKLVQNAAAAKEKEAQQPEDFFQDMTPKIIAQTKVLLRNASEQPNFARLVAPTTLIPSVGADLEDWTDDDNHQPSGDAAGWEELDDEHTKSMIREKRREQRHHVHQVQQQQKSSLSRSAANQPAFAQRKN